MTSRGLRFPDGFLWGAATASHQVEGDNRWNDWWQYEQAGRLPYRSGDACRHYERYEQDFYKIDPLLFSPAVLNLINLRSGRSYRFGETRPDILQRSFGERL